MSIQEKETAVTAAEVPTSHTEGAKARLTDLRRMREQIPHFVIPTSPKERVRLNAAASLPPEFVELTAVALTNEPPLVRGDSTTPEEIRGYMSYGDSYLPVADELEALAHFIRHSVAAARGKAGSEALTVYSLVQRLAKKPETAHLAPYVADMRRALGRRFARLTAEEREKRKAARAAKEAAAKTPTVTTPPVTTPPVTTPPVTTPPVTTPPVTTKS